MIGEKRGSAYADEEAVMLRNSLRYSLERSLDGEVIYKRGRLLTIHERELPFGLLGYTDTNDEIVLTVRRDFEIPKRKVLKHEELHCSEPDRSEAGIRYLADVEFEPPVSVGFSFYQEPLYDGKGSVSAII